ncbi:hypothetical protein ACFFRR_001652 [Megaselia abdita]
MKVIGNLLLCGSAGYALAQLGYHRPYIYSAFVVLISNSLIGILNALKTTEEGRKAYKITSIVAEMLPLAFINIELYLATGMRQEVALIHGISAIIPILMDVFASDQRNEKLKNLVMLGNVASLTFLAVIENNIWFGAVAAMGMFIRFGTSKSGGGDNASEMFAVGNATLSALAVKGILGEF